ncbi:MAG TPA: SlyX family protein [Buchnera sp. (in: enterobacteria)]|nr:SlyX family protein [Buchnera sp. (in: enterobacteria)]
MKKLFLKEKIERLETKIEFQENFIEELNQTIIFHEIEIKKIKNYIKQLVEKLKLNTEVLNDTDINIKPPHY